MLYNTGTIAINGNTATGTGTNWTAPASQVRAGQTIIVMSNPVQMFQISSVNSATSMTVTPAASPALSGQKYGILVSDNISVDGLAQAMSQLIKEYDENIGAWETFATTSANQTIPVTINGTSVNIPGIGALARKGANSDITELKGLTTALSVNQGGTGSTTSEGALSNLRALSVAGASGLKARYRFDASGGSVGIIFDDTGLSGYGSLFNDWDKKALAFNSNFNGNGQFAAHTIHRYVYPGVAAGSFYTGLTSDISYQIGHLSSSGNLTASFSFNYGGSAFANNGTWTSASDVRIKRDVNRIENPFEKMRKIRGATWYRKDSGEFGIGMIAQEIQEVFPDAVKTNGFSLTLPDGEVVKDVLFPDTAGVAAALHHEAILALMDQIEDLKKQVEALQSGS
ncbi:tail fiber domain-containing protein [Enterobacter bugandensis]